MEPIEILVPYNDPALCHKYVSQFQALIVEPIVRSLLRLVAIAVLTDYRIDLFPSRQVDVLLGQLCAVPIKVRSHTHTHEVPIIRFIWFYALFRMMEKGFHLL
jgi:hypothetical protein